jgi:multiple sugar transport system substrate-binding protein
MPLDGDNQLMYYRRDALSNPKWKAAFKKEFGYPLAPPQTWAQALDIAKFFNGKDWAGQGKAYGILEAYKRGGQAFWYFMSNCVAYCTADGEKGGLFFDYRNMKPLINDPGHVQALKNYVEALKYGPPGMINYDSGLVRSGFAAGQGVLAIDWDDTPIVGEIGTPGSKARGHIGSQLLPGTTTVWDFKKGKWIHLSKPNRVPWLAFGGWVGYIAKASKNIDASYAYLSFLASPSFSLKMVTGAATGMNPYRFSHFSNVNAWKHAKGPGATGYPEPDLNQYLAAMRASDESPKAVHDLRIPGAAAFQDASELATSRAAAGQASPQAALNDCASTWNKLNQQKGMAKQLSAFKASLNI